MLPDGAVYNSVDYIPDVIDAPLTKRGGFDYLNDSVIGSQTYIAMGAYAPFSGGAKHIAIDNGGNLYTISGGTPSSVGAAYASISRPIFYQDKLWIPAADGTSTGKSYDGSTLAAMSGSPPAGKFFDAYKDRLIIAGSSAAKRRTWFSAAADPATWNTTNGYIDATMDLTAIWALRDSIILFGQNKMERIVGSIPPPATDMERQFLFDVGCIDARSIVDFDDRLLFANTAGIYVTDGNGVDDFTQAIGALPYWQTLTSAHTSSWTYAAGRIRDFYIISVMDGTTFKDCLMIDVAQKRWGRLSNIKAAAFWTTSAAAPELYFGHRATRYVCSLSSMFSPSSTYKADADGTNVLPVLETAWRPLGDSAANLKSIVLEYDLEDAGTDNPVLVCSYALNPEDTSYTQVEDLAGTSKNFAETTTLDRAEGFVFKDARGVSIKVSQTNPSAQTRIKSIAYKGHARESGRIDW